MPNEKPQRIEVEPPEFRLFNVEAMGDEQIITAYRGLNALYIEGVPTAHEDEVVSGLLDEIDSGVRDLQLLIELQVDHSAEADDGASQAKERFVKIVADLPADA